jgi:hypothetical protein
MTTEIDIHAHLPELHAERALASIEGLAVDSVYISDLDGEFQATARAYVGATEIANLRAELSGHRSAEKMATVTIFATTYIGEPIFRPG